MCRFGLPLKPSTHLDLENFGSSLPLSTESPSQTLTVHHHHFIVSYRTFFTPISSHTIQQEYEITYIIITYITCHMSGPPSPHTDTHTQPLSKHKNYLLISHRSSNTHINTHSHILNTHDSSYHSHTSCPPFTQLHAERQ